MQTVNNKRQGSEYANTRIAKGKRQHKQKVNNRKKETKRFASSKSWSSNSSDCFSTMCKQWAAHYARLPAKKTTTTNVFSCCCCWFFLGLKIYCNTRPLVISYYFFTSLFLFLLWNAIQKMKWQKKKKKTIMADWPCGGRWRLGFSPHQFPVWA